MMLSETGETFPLLQLQFECLCEVSTALEMVVRRHERIVRLC